MKIRIIDIPPGGRNVSFPLATAEIGERIESSRTLGKKTQKSLAPDYEFRTSPEVTLHLDLEGRTVVVTGRVAGEFFSPCVRCVEDVSRHFDVPVRMVLKPLSERARPGEEEDDIELGYYDGREIDCVAVVLDFILLALPFTIVCSEECKGLCSQCGQNLNEHPCTCTPQADTAPGGNPFFKNIKLH